MAFSLLRSLMWAKVAAGVACVMRAVLITPTFMSRRLACSSSVGSRRPSPSPLKSMYSVESSNPITPALVFAPLIIAVIVGALSGVIASAE